MRCGCRAAFALALPAMLAACDHASPVEPSAAVTATISAVRYERVKPLVAADAAPVVVSIWYALAPGDPYGRTSARLCVLERAGASAFVCPSPHFEGIPVGREWSASVTDAAVSGFPVARDLYLNGTRIRVEDFATGGESGRFQIDARGRVW